jgi:hypothetical protein
MVVKIVNLRDVFILELILIPSHDCQGYQNLEQGLAQVIPFEILAAPIWQGALLKEIDGGRNHEIED